MAGAVIGMVAPIAIPVINDLVAKLVEKLFPPKSGAQKLPAATEISAAIQGGLSAVGALLGTPQTGADLTNGVQSTVTALNAKGVLKGPATVIDGPLATEALASDILVAASVFLKSVGK